MIYSNIGTQAVEFIKRLFHIYLEDRNFPELISMLHKNITWFGTGKQEICRSFEDAVKLLEAESQSWNGRFKIKEEWYEHVVLDEQKILVYGGLKISEDGLNIILMDMESRFSMVCTMENGIFKLLHAHFSVPNAAQTDDEFVHKTLVGNYNRMLEEKLMERTKLLKDKTEELETLTDNIQGGVQICRFDDDFTVLYTSGGFRQLTGYDKEAIDSLFQGKHTAIVNPKDIDTLQKNLRGQLAHGNHFSVEYRIRHREGYDVWVLDKGVLIYREDGQVNVQCILTDITERIRQEEELRLSEKRYEIAMQLSEITMFEYDINSKELLLFEDTADMYAMPSVIPDGVNTFIEKGIIEASTVPEYREMYRKICSGAPKAKCYVKTRDKFGKLHDYELSLTNVYDSKGNPKRAIGVRKNVSQMMTLQKEQEFGKTLVSNKILVFEADMTTDRVEYLHEMWTKQLGAADDLQYSYMLKQMVPKVTAPEHQKLFWDKLNKDAVIRTLSQGESLITFKYKRRDHNDVYIWYEAFVNIIKNQLTGNISIRFYHSDVNESKLKEQKALEEHRLYETMIAKAKLAYEVNITRNLAVKGHEDWEIRYKIKKSDDYSVMIREFSHKGVHPEDREGFLNQFLRKHVIKCYQAGENQLACEYRKKDEFGEYRWASCVLHLFEEVETGDIKGYFYVEDIDDDKKAELALKYQAEHDMMTGVLNKVSTEERVREYLDSKEGKSGVHAFLILDIDHFKYVNDNFGHLFGDGVIKEVASKICSIFRDDDIVGRIGGDEFCVFMKNVSYGGVITSKAEELCTYIHKLYESNGKSCTVSVSIGISVYPKQGITYGELYENADHALYLAKKNGRNRFEM